MSTIDQNQLEFQTKSHTPPDHENLQLELTNPTNPNITTIIERKIQKQQQQFKNITIQKKTANHYFESTASLEGTQRTRFN